MKRHLPFEALGFLWPSLYDQTGNYKSIIKNRENQAKYKKKSQNFGDVAKKENSIHFSSLIYRVRMDE